MYQIFSLSNEGLLTMREGESHLFAHGDPFENEIDASNKLKKMLVGKDKEYYINETFIISSIYKSI